MSKHDRKKKYTRFEEVVCERGRKGREEGTCECNGGGMKNEVTWFSLSFEGQGEAPEYSWKGPV